MKKTVTAPVTMRQIAERAKVSIGTVSHVINGTATVRAKRRDRVLEAIRSFGYQPSALAQGLRRKRTNMLGMIIPDVTNPFFPGVVRGAEDVAYKHSYRVILCNADNDPEKEASYIRELRTYHVAGLLIIPSGGTETPHPLASPAVNNTPVVCIDRVANGWKGDAVLVANENGAYEATRHMIQFGHRRLAAISGPLAVTNAGERLRGFRRALDEAGIRIDPEFVQEGRFDLSSGRQAALRLLRMLPRPTAIFACNDLMALGVLQAARDLGIHCPEDLSIVGFDSLEFTGLTDPPITSVYQPGYQLGATAARLLLQRVEGLNSAPKKIVLPTELRKRNSVASPPGAAVSPRSTPKRRGSDRPVRRKSALR
jgi:LacI family transcriptional regulator